MLDWVLGRKKKPKKRGRRKPKPDYETSKKIAAGKDVAARAELAAHEDLEPEFLYFFASDDEASVRREVARNDGSPLQADVILARDVDPQVREELAYKIGRLIPNLTPDENERLVEMTFEVLEILAKDQLPKIREIVADEIKHLDHVPKRVIKQLAHDAEETVAGPILEYSPLLSDEQILQIVTSGLRGGALDAIARRHGISDEISRAVFEQDQDSSLAALLQNQFAEISDKLMDEIAVHVEDKPDLHLPLVDRGSLSPMTLRRIATFVSAALMERLINVNVIDDDTAKELRMAVRNRIETGKENAAEKPSGARHADTLHKKGELDDYAILDAIDEADTAFIRRALVLMASLSDEHVDRMLHSGSSKGVCALAWKAGLGADTSVSLQRRVGKVPSKSIIKEGAGGKYAMTDDELEWYVDYFKNPS